MQGVVEPRRVKQFCKQCPFQVDCLAYALSHDVKGIWGGTTGLERKHIRRRYQIPAMSMADTYA
jgi:hypothetical protein